MGIAVSDFFTFHFKVHQAAAMPRRGKSLNIVVVGRVNTERRGRSAHTPTTDFYFEGGAIASVSHSKEAMDHALSSASSKQVGPTCLFQQNIIGDPHYTPRCM